MLSSKGGGLSGNFGGDGLAGGVNAGGGSDGSGGGFGGAGGGTFGRMTCVLRRDLRRLGRLGPDSDDFFGTGEVPIFPPPSVDDW